MARRKPKVQDVAADKYTVDSGSDDSRRSGGFDPLLGYTAVGGAALTAGYIAGKASGVGARVVNKVTKQKVVLHGRQTANYDYIKPAGGKYANDKNLSQYAYSWYDNPQAKTFGRVGGEALPFAHGGGTLYAVKGRASSFKSMSGGKVDWDVDNVVTSQINQKVVGSIPIRHAGLEDYSNEILKMLKKAGGKVPKKR